MPITLSCHWGMRGADITCTMASRAWHQLWFCSIFLKSWQAKVKDRTPLTMKWNARGFFMTTKQQLVMFVSDTVTILKHTLPKIKLPQRRRCQLFFKHSKLKLGICLCTLVYVDWRSVYLRSTYIWGLCIFDVYAYLMSMHIWGLCIFEVYVYLRSTNTWGLYIFEVYVYLRPSQWANSDIIMNFWWISK